MRVESQPADHEVHIARNARSRSLSADFGASGQGNLEMRLSGFGRSIHLDVGGLDHRPPFCDLGLLPGAERFRRRACPSAASAGRDFRAACARPDRSAPRPPPRSTWRRCPSACPWAPTGRTTASCGSPACRASSTGRNVGRRGDALVVGDGIGADVAGAHLADRVGGLVDDDIDLAGDEIVHRRRRCRDTARIAA